MKKYSKNLSKILFIVLSLILCDQHNSNATCLYPQTGVYPWGVCQGGTYYNHATWTGPYATVAAATAAGQAGPGSYMKTDNSGAWRYVQYGYWQSTCHLYTYNYFFCEVGHDCSCDNDMDGITDDHDPYPDDPTDHKWRIRATCSDGQGNIVAYMIEIDNGDKFWLGDKEACTEENLEYVMGDPWHNSLTELNDYVNQTQESQSEGTDGSQTYNYDDGEPTSTAEDIQAGTDDTGNSTDGDKLSDIVNNTEKMTDNQQVMADYLKDLNQKAFITNQQLENIHSDLENLEVTADVDSDAIGEAVGDQIQEKIIGDETGQSAISTGENYMSEVDTAMGDYSEQSDENFSGEYTEEQIPDEYKEYTDLEEQNSEAQETIDDVKSVITNSEIETTGQCYFSYNYKGQDVDFTLCEYEEQLQDWGVLMLGISGLHGLMIIFRKS